MEDYEEPEIKESSELTDNNFSTNIPPQPEKVIKYGKTILALAIVTFLGIWIVFIVGILMLQYGIGVWNFTTEYIFWVLISLFLSVIFGAIGLYAAIKHNSGHGKLSTGAVSFLIVVIFLLPVAFPNDSTFALMIKFPVIILAIITVLIFTLAMDN